MSATENAERIGRVLFRQFITEVPNRIQESLGPWSWRCDQFPAKSCGRAYDRAIQPQRDQEYRAAIPCNPYCSRAEFHVN